MARYRVLEKSHINGRIFEAGEEVEYAGEPDGNLEPLDAEGEAAAEARAKKVAEAKVKSEALERLRDSLKNGGFDDLV